MDGRSVAAEEAVERRPRPPRSLGAMAGVAIGMTRGTGCARRWWGGVADSWDGWAVTPTHHRRVVGTLHVVATPIGNLADLSSRAASVLRSVPVVAAEDTRVARRLRHVASSTATPSEPAHPHPRFISVHEHAGAVATAAVIAAAAGGQDVALSTDAGTPCIADPGWHVVAAAHAAGIPVAAVPGPSSVTTALSVAGVDCSSGWHFLGWASARPGAVPAGAQPPCPHRIAAEAAALLRVHSGDPPAIPTPRPVVMLESWRRLPATLSTMLPVLQPPPPHPPVGVVLCRELTKAHEEVMRFDTLAAAVAELDRRRGAEPESLAGEFVVILHRPPLSPPPPLRATNGADSARPHGGPAMGGRHRQLEALAPHTPLPAATTPHPSPPTEVEEAASLVDATVASGEGVKPSRAIRWVSEATGVPRSELYAAWVRRRAAEGGR